MCKFYKKTAARQAIAAAILVYLSNWHNGAEIN